VNAVILETIWAYAHICKDIFSELFYTTFSISFKTERLLRTISNVQRTDRQSDRLDGRLVMLIKNIYTLYGRKRLLHCVTNFWLKL